MAGTNPTFFGEGHEPRLQDPKWKIEQKILGALIDHGGGGGGTGVETGVGSPEGVVTAAVGTLYLDLTDTDNPDLWAKTTGAGNTGWASLVI